MILAIVKYHENLLKDSTLAWLFIVKFFSSLETKMIVKLAIETFLRITRYLLIWSEFVKNHQVECEPRSGAETCAAKL